MKRIIYTYILLLMLPLSITSCKKFLEKEPVGRVSKGALFEDVNGAKVALVGSYRLMLDYKRTEFGMFGDVASDNVISIASASNANSVMLEAFNFSHTADDAIRSSYYIWQNIYATLNNVNNIINALDGLKTKYPGQLAQIEEIEGQALVMRAICFLDLSEVFAQPYNYTADGSHLGIPIPTKTPSPGAAVPRATIKETYDQILSDLNTSLPYLVKYRNGGDQALISYQAALGLLSRVYLYKGDWENCVKTADMVISDNKYRLANAAEYKQVFNTYPASTGSNASVKIETLFHLSGSGIEKVNAKEIISVFSSPSIAQYAASSKLVGMFKPDDIRLSSMFKNVGPNFISNKYGEIEFAKTQAYLVKVIRLSEVYLNRAEAKWNLKKYSEAAADLKIIYQRARTGSIEQIIETPEVLYQTIADERNRELCFEGHRLFDIVRRKENLQRGSDCNATVCTLNYPNNKFILPFNTRELEANPALKQNPGYN